MNLVEVDLNLAYKIGLLRLGLWLPFWRGIQYVSLIVSHRITLHRKKLLPDDD